MKANSPDWYRHGWTLEIKNQSWVEDTEKQVNFLINTLALTGNERILDIACGFGRHALSLAKKGFSVTGIDITKAYIDDAMKTAKTGGLNAQFIHADIRETSFSNEFDVVINMADGAIGYLESDAENLKIFDAISCALKPGGKHFMDICNAEHAENFFPKSSWQSGQSALALAQFEWDKSSRRMLYGGWNMPYGLPANKPEILVGDPTRLYSVAELEDIFNHREMKIINTFSDFDGSPATFRELQLLVYSTKNLPQ